MELCNRKGKEWKKDRCLFGKGSLEFLPPPKYPVSYKVFPFNSFINAGRKYRQNFNTHFSAFHIFCKWVQKGQIGHKMLLENAAGFLEELRRGRKFSGGKLTFSKRKKKLFIEVCACVCVFEIGEKVLITFPWLTSVTRNLSHHSRVCCIIPRILFFREL